MDVPRSWGTDACDIASIGATRVAFSVGSMTDANVTPMPMTRPRTAARGSKTSSLVGIGRSNDRSSARSPRAISTPTPSPTAWRRPRPRRRPRRSRERDTWSPAMPPRPAANVKLALTLRDDDGERVPDEEPADEERDRGKAQKQADELPQLILDHGFGPRPATCRS